MCKHVSLYQCDMFHVLYDAVQLQHNQSTMAVAYKTVVAAVAMLCAVAAAVDEEDDDDDDGY